MKFKVVSRLFLLVWLTTAIQSIDILKLVSKTINHDFEVGDIVCGSRKSSIFFKCNLEHAKIDLKAESEIKKIQKTCDDTLSTQKKNCAMNSFGNCLLSVKFIENICTKKLLEMKESKTKEHMAIESMCTKAINENAADCENLNKHEIKEDKTIPDDAQRNAVRRSKIFPVDPVLKNNMDKLNNKPGVRYINSEIKDNKVKSEIIPPITYGKKISDHKFNKAIAQLEKPNIHKLINYIFGDKEYKFQKQNLMSYISNLFKLDEEDRDRYIKDAIETHEEEAIHNDIHRQQVQSTHSNKHKSESKELGVEKSKSKIPEIEVNEKEEEKIEKPEVYKPKEDIIEFKEIAKENQNIEIPIIIDKIDFEQNEDKFPKPVEVPNVYEQPAISLPDIDLLSSQTLIDFIFGDKQNNIDRNNLETFIDYVFQRGEFRQIGSYQQAIKLNHFNKHIHDISATLQNPTNTKRPQQLTFDFEKPKIENANNEKPIAQTILNHVFGVHQNELEKTSLESLYKSLLGTNKLNDHQAGKDEYSEIQIDIPTVTSSVCETDYANINCPLFVSSLFEALKPKIITLIEEYNSNIKEIEQQDADKEREQKNKFAYNFVFKVLDELFRLNFIELGSEITGMPLENFKLGENNHGLNKQKLHMVIDLLNRLMKSNSTLNKSQSNNEKPKYSMSNTPENKPLISNLFDYIQLQSDSKPGILGFPDKYKDGKIDPVKVIQNLIVNKKPKVKPSKNEENIDVSFIYNIIDDLALPDASDLLSNLLPDEYEPSGKDKNDSNTQTKPILLYDIFKPAKVTVEQTPEKENNEEDEPAKEDFDPEVQIIKPGKDGKPSKNQDLLKITTAASAKIPKKPIEIPIKDKTAKQTTKPKEMVKKPKSGPSKPKMTTKKPKSGPSKSTITTKKPKSVLSKPKKTTKKPKSGPSKSTVTTKKPKSGPSKSKHTTKKPKSDPSKPKKTTKKPKSGPSKSKQTTKKPKSGPSKPKKTTKKPKSELSKPKITTKKPKSGPSNPKKTTKKPNSEPSQPKRTTKKPKSGPSKSTITTKKPKSVLSQPKKTTKKPKSGPSKSTETTKKPKSGPSKSKQTTKKPKSDPSKPKKTTKKPKSETSKSIKTTKKPKLGPSKSKITTRKPKSGFLKANNETKKPKSSTPNPK